MTVHVSNFGLDENSDDRTEYASIQAILYGPCLLAGHTTSDWDIKNVAADSLSELITPIPAAHNDHLEIDSNLNLQVAKHDHSVFCLVAGLDSRKGLYILERHKG
ncbi:hypothetical protein OIU85_025648 [Salix viminalis]|uniref:Uncharacterized protein n=1 Tax=Salix viminalis TaxID=40686 RepID=A0A9Q0TLU9_SALVM|nr:hypothetical protein OIU85_025648 [Salix viminalis]